MNYDELNEASKIDSDIIKSHKPKSRRITITQDDRDAFFMLWDMYSDADSASDGTWISDEERKKIERLHKKIYGK